MCAHLRQDARSQLASMARTFPPNCETGLRGGSAYAKRLRGDAEDPTDFRYRRERDAEVLTGFLRARRLRRGGSSMTE
jgi:hypothetical protein